MKIIVVDWWDAGSGHDCDEAANIFRKSVGYEVRREQGFGVWISMEDDQLSSVHFVPWGMIRSITTVQE